MRATGEHTAAIPLPFPAPAADDADKEKRRRRRQPRRPKQSPSAAAAAATSQGWGGSMDLVCGAAAATRASKVAFSSMPAMHVDDDCDAELAASEMFTSCPLPDSSSCPVEAAPAADSKAGSRIARRCFEPHWPEHAVKEAIKKGKAFKGKFRVNAYNRVEAYCMIEGLPVDVLISGAAQNRAMEGDVVAIMLDPVVYWNRMKGLNLSCTPRTGGDSMLSEVAEINWNNFGMKEQVDANCASQYCSNGMLASEKMHQYHKSGNFSEAVHCENGYCTVPENYEKELDGESEAARALQRICAMIYSNPNKRPTGKVLSIIKMSPRREAIIGFLVPFSEFLDGERQRKQTGVQNSRKKNGRVSSSDTDFIGLLPTDPKFPKMVVSVAILPYGAKQRLIEGDATVARELVAARVDEWDEECLFPRAHIIQLLGKGGEIEAQIGAIMFENAINSAKFSPESLACLPDVSWKIPKEELETRKDLRNILTFTIDPPSATDLDDALSVEVTSGGIVRIGVHIADVSYFVHPDTALDTEARIRSTSVYILQHRVPMLPPSLSEGLASLIPGVDRLAFSIVWDIDPHGNIVNRWIGRSIIFSCCKLSYDFVRDIISIDADQFNSCRISAPQLHGRFGWEDVIKSLRCLYHVSKNLREARFKDGALSLESAKLMFLFDEGGTPYDSYRYGRNEACSLVEEFMLLANRSVAEVISSAFPDCALLRRHPEPNLRKLREFEAFCARNGFELDASSSGQLHLSLSKIRKKLKDDPVLFDILILYASKPMQSAAYFCTGDMRGKKDDWAHYALSVPLYTHFTSPLRRYPDIIVHRTLYALIEAEEIYLKHNGVNKVKLATCEMGGRCFTGLQFNKDAAESKEGREALSVAAMKFNVLGSEVLGEVAEYCNERKLASHRAEEAGEKLYLWALLKRKEVIVSRARVLGLGPRFMSVYVHELAIERRIYYDEVEGLAVEWLETMGTLVLDVHKNKPQRRGSPIKYRAMEEVALVMNPSELVLSGVVEESGAAEAECATANLAPVSSVVKTRTAPAVIPLVIHHLSDIPVALHASGGDDGPLDIGVRLYISSYLR